MPPGGMLERDCERERKRGRKMGRKREAEVTDFCGGAGSLYLAQQLMYIYLTGENAGPQRLISSHDAPKQHISRCVFRYRRET